MKLHFLRILAAVLGFLLPMSAHGTHLLGGEMTYTHLGTNGAGWNEYEVRVAIYRDCSSANTNQTDFDAVASLGVYLNGALVSNFSSLLDEGQIQNILPEDPNSCAEFPEDLCIERGEYVFTIALAPASAPYVLSYQRCCRTPAIVNLEVPDDQGFTLTTEIPGTAAVAAPNSSPVFNNLPQAFVCNNLPFELDNSATDPDGDSLAYQICSIYIGATPLMPIPSPPLGPPFNEVAWSVGFGPSAPLQVASGIAIDPVTGLLTGTPVGLGKYAIGVCVEEWRDGVLMNSILRDFTLDVVSCALSAPFYANVEPCQGMEVAFDQTSNPASTYSWDFGFPGPQGTSSEAEPTVTFPAPGTYNVSLLFTSGDCSGEATFSVTAQVPWSVEATMGTPECGDGGWWVPVTPPAGLPDSSSYTWEFGAGAQPEFAADETPELVWFPPGNTVDVLLFTESVGCEALDAVTVDLPDLPQAAFTVASPPCQGLTVAFANTWPQSGPFAWQFGDGAVGTGPNPVHTYSDYGPYTITAIAGGGTACADTSQQAFEVHPLDPFEAAFDAKPVYACDSLSRVQLTYLGLPADGLEWSFPGLPVESGTSAVLAFDTPGLQVGALNLYHEGCDLSLAWPVEVTAPEPIPEVTYRVPNVFSPNNDGRNERFAVEYLTPDGGPAEGLTNSNFSLHELKVFNRWGGMVFDSDEALAGWWGEGASEGTYYVVFKAQHVCAEVPHVHQGEVTLVR